MDLQAALDLVLRNTRPSRRDAALTTEIVYGLLRNRERVRFVVDHFLRNPKGLSSLVRQIMDIAAYEMLFLDKVPGYASVDWAVEAVKQATGPKQAGLVNAVLRNINRLGHAAHEKAFFGSDENKPALFSAYYSMPTWIVEMWLRDYGPEQTEAFLSASAQAAPVGLRLNEKHPDAQTVGDTIREKGEVLAETGNAFALSGTAGLELEKLEAEGVLTRQSYAAQEIMHALECDAWPRPIWDACAGRGGKTALLLEQDKGEVWASDRNMKRLKGLRPELKRLGLPDIPVFACDTTRPALAKEPRTIFLDAPCSGLGTLSRRPDIKYKRNPHDVESLVDVQHRMLSAAAEMLPAGGALVYITCTINTAENEEAVQQLLRDRNDLVEEGRRLTSDGKKLGEFFFGVRLKKKEG